MPTQYLEPGEWAIHDPDEVLDYGIEWNATRNPRLESGETIAQSAWSVVSGTATIAATATGGTPTTSTSGSIVGTVTTFWLRTSSAGLVRVLNAIQTSLGRTMQMTVDLNVTPR
jgi:broad specificity phosphatase PhoE